MMEYAFGTTRAAMNLVFSRALEQFPRIRFILSHAGVRFDLAREEGGRVLCGGKRLTGIGSPTVLYGARNVCAKVEESR